MADASTDAVQPAGVPPVGDGGPLVGPYGAANVSSVAVTFPANSGSYTTTNYNAGCTPTGICGTAAWQSNSNTRAVAVSIKRLSDNLYWNGSTFASATEVFVTATCATTSARGCGLNTNNSGTVNWTYAFAAPAAGSYEVRARAGDSDETEFSATNTFSIDNIAPTVTLAATTASPTNSTSLTFTLTGDENLNCASLSTTSGVDFTFGNLTSIGSITGTGTPVCTIAATSSIGPGAMGTSSLGEAGSFSVSDTAGNAQANIAAGAPASVVVDRQAPTVTLAATTVSPTNSTSLTFTLTGNENLNCATLSTGSGIDFTFSNISSIGSITGTGTPFCTITATSWSRPARGTSSLAEDGSFSVSDTAGNPQVNISAGSPASVVVDRQAPTVTINQAPGQADPTHTSPINFRVVFSEAVIGFATGDVTIGGTAPGTKIGTVTGSGTTYTVAVTGMTASGTVTASLTAVLLRMPRGTTTRHRPASTTL